MAMKTACSACVLYFFYLLFSFSSLYSDIISREGSGFLESVQGEQVLHLRGTPYERGFQQGVLMKEQILRNISTYIDKKESPVPGRVEEFSKNISTLLSYVPESFKQEMQGLSDGCGAPLQKIIAMNLFPEMFHCSGIAVSDTATLNGDLYHARVLDYSVGKNLQSTAVLQIVEPESGIPYLNVSYAGFIGTVTGMNLHKIAIGEIGGLGYGSWQGIPMSFLLREILEKASSLEDAKAILENAPRTCEYYYILSDGKTKQSMGVYATASQLRYFEPGVSYALIAPSGLPANYGTNGDNDKFILTDCSIESTEYQTLLFEKDRRLALLFRLQPPDCLLLTGFPTPERYLSLVNRVLENYGSIDAHSLMEIIKRPVAKESNLHNAIFKPSALKVWIAHAGLHDEPACDQPYLEWDLQELLNHDP